MSALLNCRSQANVLPATDQERLPCRSPSLTPGSSAASRATSSMVTTVDTVVDVALTQDAILLIVQLAPRLRHPAGDGRLRVQAAGGTVAPAVPVTLML